MVNARTLAVVCGDVSLLRCFERSGIPTAALYSDPASLVRYSRACGQKFRIADCRVNMEAAVDDIIRFAQHRPAPSVLYYGADETLLMVSRHRDRLMPYYRFRLPPVELVEDLVDKMRFVDLARRLSLPIPKSVSSREACDFGKARQAISLPCVLKPACRVGWFGSSVFEEIGDEPRKALRADTPEEFHRLYNAVRRHTDEFVMQEYVPGEDSSIYSFHAYYDRNSRPLAWYVGRKIRTYPMDSGISTYLELVKDREVACVGMEVLGKMNFVGAVKADFKRDAVRNRLMLLEINPRYTLWNHLGAACGVNLPLVAYDDLMERPCRPPADYRTDIRWLAFSDDVRAFLRGYRREGLLTWFQWLGSLRGRKVHELFSWRDPLPWAVSAMRFGMGWLRKLVAKVVK